MIELTSEFVTDVSIETKIYTMTKKGLNEKSKWSDLLFVGHRCSNECIDLSSEKHKCALNIDGWWTLLLRAERWSNPVETKIILERTKGLSETVRGDQAYLSAMTDESNSMETTISLEWEARTWIKVPLVTEFAFQGQNESRIPCDVTRDGNEWYINFGFVQLILHCSPATLFRWKSFDQCKSC